MQAIDHLIVLDPHLIAFVRKSLGSIWALEVLLLIRRHAPTAVRREQIVRELRATPQLVGRVVDRLAEEQLVVAESDDSVRFQPSTPELETLCTQLEAAVINRPIALRDAIVGSTDAKLRNFADAFRLRGKDENK